MPETRRDDIGHAAGNGPRRQLLKAGVGCLLALDLKLAHGSAIAAVRVWPAREYTRVTLELAGGQRMVREVQAGSSYLSSEDPRLHFGLGRAARVKALVVRLPGGRIVRRGNIAANQVVTIP